MILFKSSKLTLVYFGFSEFIKLVVNSTSFNFILSYVHICKFVKKTINLYSVLLYSVFLANAIFSMC